MRGTLEGLMVAAMLAALVWGAERAATVRPPAGAHPPIDTHRRLPAARHELARGLIEQGRASEARDITTTGAADESGAWKLLGEAAVQELSGHDIAAIDLYERATDLSPELRAAKLGLARTVLRMRQWSNPAKAHSATLDRWLAADPYDASLAIARAQRDGDRALASASAAWPADAPIALAYAGRLERSDAAAARDVLARALASNRSDPELAMVYASAHERDGAACAAALRTAIAATRTPRHARIALAAAAWFDERRSEKDVVAALEAAALADPTSPRIALERSAWLCAHGRAAEARAALAGVRHDDPLWQASGDGVADPDTPRPRRAETWLALASGAEGQGLALEIAGGTSPLVIDELNRGSFLRAASTAALERRTDRLANSPSWDRAAAEATRLAAAAGWPPASLAPWQARRERLTAGPIAAASTLATAGGVAPAVKALSKTRRPELALALESPDLFTYAHERCGLPSLLALSIARLSRGPAVEAVRALSDVLDLEELIALVAHFRPGPRWQAALTVGQALHSHSWEPADRACNAALSANPTDPAALDELARLLTDLCDLPAAQRALRRALSLAPTPVREAKLGALLMRTGDRAEALQHLVRGAEGGEYNHALASAVRPEVAAGHLDLAEACARATATYYDTADCHLDVAWICTLRGKKTESASAIAEALARTHSAPDKTRVEIYARSLREILNR